MCTLIATSVMLRTLECVCVVHLSQNLDKMLDYNYMTHVV